MKNRGKVLWTVIGLMTSQLVAAQLYEEEEIAYVDIYDQGHRPSTYAYTPRSVEPKVDDGFDEKPGDLPSDAPVSDGVLWIGAAACVFELLRRIKLKT